MTVATRKRLANEANRACAAPKLWQIVGFLGPKTALGRAPANAGTSSSSCSDHRLDRGLCHDAGIKPDPPLRQPGRAKVARSLHTQGNHDHCAPCPRL